MLMAKINTSQNSLGKDDSDLVSNPIRSPMDSEIHVAAQMEDCGLDDALQYSF